MSSPCSDPCVELGCINMYPPGHTRLEHPPELRHGVSSYYNPTIDDQHRVGGRLERCHFTHDHIPFVCVYHLDRMRIPKTDSGRAAPTPSVVTREIWHGGEFWGVGVPLSTLCLCILSPDDGSYG